MSVKLLLFFALTEFVLCLTPGPAVLLVASQGMRFGFIGGLRGTAGVVAGNTFYFFLSALGLGTVLLASPKVFLFVKWFGIAYLVLTGIKMLLTRRNDDTNQADPAPNRALTLFSQGVLTQLANPRAIIFFTALLPQFISPGGRVLQQFLLLGMISIAVEFPVLAGYAWLAHQSRSLISERFALLPTRIAGGFLIGAGIGLAAIRRS